MWILTYTTPQAGPYHQGEFFQEAWFALAAPNVSYLSSYLKHFNLTDKSEPWDIRKEAQRLCDGETVRLNNFRDYRLWEKEQVGVLPMY